MHLILNDEALAEIVEIRAWLRNQSAQREAAFLAEIERGFNQLRTFPWSGASYLRQTRKLLIDRGMFLIVHIVGDDHILVLHVAHTSRKPGYWLEEK